MERDILKELYDSSESILRQEGPFDNALEFGQTGFFEFKRGKRQSHEAQFLLTNSSEFLLTFKIKTNSSLSYLVYPCIYVVMPRSSFSLRVQFIGQDVSQIFEDIESTLLVNDSY